MPSSPNASNDRRRWMGILAKARPAEIDAAWSRLPGPPDYEMLRRPETGLVMVQGRIGGDGAGFNMGEMTVTRCSVRLDDGTVGHAWVAGRVATHAERAAVLDALLQAGTHRQSILAEVEALAQAQSRRRDAVAVKAGAIRVEFFTLVRGEG